MIGGWGGARAKSRRREVLKVVEGSFEFLGVVVVDFIFMGGDGG